MICCAFIFTPGEYDEDFFHLDRAIETYARSLDGFIKVEGWYSDDKKSKNSMYYFESHSVLEKLANLPAHIKAKGQVDRWYQDYRIEVFEVTEIYGKNAPRILTT